MARRPFQADPPPITTAFRLSDGAGVICPTCADGISHALIELATLPLGTECAGCDRVFTLHRGKYHKNRVAQWIKTKTPVEGMKEAIDDDDHS